MERWMSSSMASSEARPPPARRRLRKCGEQLRIRSWAVERLEKAHEVRSVAVGQVARPVLGHAWKALLVAAATEEGDDVGERTILSRVHEARSRGDASQAGRPKGPVHRSADRARQATVVAIAELAACVQRVAENLR